MIMACQENKILWMSNKKLVYKYSLLIAVGIPIILYSSFYPILEIARINNPLILHSIVLSFFGTIVIIFLAIINTAVGISDKGIILVYPFNRETRILWSNVLGIKNLKRSQKKTGFYALILKKKYFRGNHGDKLILTQNFSKEIQKAIVDEFKAYKRDKTL